MAADASSGLSPVLVGSAAAGVALAGVVALLLVAPGQDGGKDTVAPPPTAAPAATASLTFLFQPDGGLTFVDLPTETVAEMRRVMEAVEAHPRVRGAFMAVEGRTAVEGGLPVAVAVAFRMDDRLAAEEGFARDFFAMTSSAMGPERQDLVLAGRPVVALGELGQIQTLVFHQGDLAIFVGAGRDRPALERVMATVVAKT